LCNQLSGLGSLLTVPEYCYPFRLNETHTQNNDINKPIASE